VRRSLEEVLAGLEEAEREAAELEDGGDVEPVSARLGACSAQLELRSQAAQGLELLELKSLSQRLRRVQQAVDKSRQQQREFGRATSQQAVKDAREALEAAEGDLKAAQKPQKAELSRLAELKEIAHRALAGAAAAAEAAAASEGLDTQAKVELARLQLRVQGVEKKGRATAENIASEYELRAAELTARAVSALRAAARREDGSCDPGALFLELSDGTGEITEGQFRAYFERHEELELSPEEAGLAFARLAPSGLSRRALAAAIGDFLTVAQGVTLTDRFEVQSAKRVRALEAGELLEALERKTDQELGLERAKCRAVRDGALGWATLKGGAEGEAFLEPGARPFLLCLTECMLCSAESGGRELRNLEPGEAVELLEGPREAPGNMGELRVRGVTCGDGLTGWLLVRDRDGQKLAELAPQLQECLTPIAMTDSAELAGCCLVRRIEPGEALEPLEGEARPTEGGLRRRFRACRDGLEGWVTVDGTGGTRFLEPARRHWLLHQEAPLLASLASESPTLRTLAPGEAFAGHEEPKRSAAGGRQLRKVRAILDGREGWVAAGEELRSWPGRYKVQEPFELEGGRRLESGELVELQGIPAEGGQGTLAHLRALSDGAAGWAPPRGAAGLALEPVQEEEPRPKRRRKGGR